VLHVAHLLLRGGRQRRHADGQIKRDAENRDVLRRALRLLALQVVAAGTGQKVVEHRLRRQLI
jgi:hypothetical protein